MRVSDLGQSWRRKNSWEASHREGRIVPNSEKPFPVCPTSVKGGVDLYWDVAKREEKTDERDE